MLLRFPSRRILSKNLSFSQSIQFPNNPHFYEQGCLRTKVHTKCFDATAYLIASGLSENRNNKLLSSLDSELSEDSLTTSAYKAIEQRRPRAGTIIQHIIHRRSNIKGYPSDSCCLEILILLVYPLPMARCSKVDVVVNAHRRCTLSCRRNCSRAYSSFNLGSLSN